ncbi:MAG TPA: universal stress protein [Acidimicrobiales bacterium]
MRPMIVGFSGSESAAALRWSGEVAASTGAALTVTSTKPMPLASTEPEDFDGLVRAQRAAVEDLLRDLGPRDVEVDVDVRDPLDALIDRAEKRDASLVVVSAEDHVDVDDVGGFAVRLLRKAQRAVAVVPRSYEPPSGGTFVVGVDGSDANTAALALAESLAREMGASIKAVFAYDVIDDTYTHAEGWHRHSDEVRAELANATSVPVDLLMEAGPADMVLLDVAQREHAAIIVVGTRGRMSLGTSWVMSRWS